MLIGKKLIFVHHPRTGGNSVSAYLKRAVPDRYFPAADPKLDDERKTWLIHRGLAICYQYANRLGIDPFQVPTLACIRNPYSLALSGYLYLVQRQKAQAGIIEETFGEYLQNLLAKTPEDVLEQRAGAAYGPFSNFITLGGDIIPDNLTIARTESLADDVEAFVKDQVGVKAPKGFPHKNAIEHGHFSEYYGEDEEALVYRLYRNVFDSGLYQRYAGLDQGNF